MKTIRINNRVIGSGFPVYIIAELSANHCGSLEIAKKTVHAIAASGADAVKLQTYLPETITMDSDLPHFRTRDDSLWAGRRLFDLYEEAHTPWEWHPVLQQLAHDLGLDFFSSPFDHTSVDFLEALNVPAYKIASLEIVDIPLVRYVASKQKPIIVSTGIANEEDIQLAINTCHEVGNTQIALLKCTSEYPTPFEEAHIRSIKTLADKFNEVVGLSDHTIGTVVPILSVAMGATIIEKHFILDKSMDSVDRAFSLDAEEFKALVADIRSAVKALGSPEIVLTDKMKKARTMCRSLFATRDIQKGEVLSSESIGSLRPGNGLHPRNFDALIGKKAKVSISRGTPLSWKLVQSDE